MSQSQEPLSQSEREKAALLAVKGIEKQFGSGSILKLDTKTIKKLPSIPTGLPSVDNFVLGIGGIPKGRMTEIYGPESGGKTTLGLTLIASVQRNGGMAAMVDAEHALDPKWAELLGVDVNKLFVSQPDTGEQGLQIVEKLVEANAFDMILVDSVAALTPRAEIEGEIGDALMGVQARMMSQACRKFTPILGQTSTALVFINQIRDKIGVMFGSPETTTGGRALKFYSSIRLDVRRVSTIKKNDIAIGNNVRIKAAKNKCAPPYRETEVELLFNKGFNIDGDLIDMATTLGLITKSGSWFSYGETKIGQGKDSVTSWLESEPSMKEELYKRLYNE